MIYQESNDCRRVVGRLDRGDDCIEELEAFCNEHDVEAADLRTVGRLSHVELVRFDAEEGDYREMFADEGTFDLLQGTGTVSVVGNRPVVRLQALLAAEGPVAPQLVAGQLRSAEVLELEFTLDIFRDLAVERHRDDTTGRLTVQSIRRTETSADDEEGPAMEGQSMSWDEAADDPETGEDAPAEPAPTATDAADDAPENDGDDEDESDPFEGLDEPFVEAGDAIEHPKLGRCRVIKVEEGEYVHIRVPRGKIRKLSLDVVDISYRGEENGRNVFDAEINA